MNRSFWFITYMFSLITVFTQSGYSQNTIPKRKEILVLHSVEEARPWNTTYNRSFKDALKKDSTINANVSIENLDFIRNNTTDYKDIIEKTIHLKYHNNPPDILVITQNEAIKFVFERNLFPEIPKILVYITDGVSPHYSNSTTITSVYNFDTKLKHALSIFPKTKDIYVISGNNKIDSYLLEKFKSNTGLLNKQVSFKYLTNLNKSAILDTVENLPENSFVYYLPYTQDLNGDVVMVKDFACDLAKNCNRPVFSFIDLLTEDTGIFGGMVMSLKLEAEKTVEVIGQVLNGKTIENIAPLKTHKLYVYNWNELKKWNIDSNTLPKESIFYNRKYTFLELYKKEVYEGIILLLFYSILLILLLYSNRKIRRSKKQLKKQNTNYELLNSKYKSQNELLKIAKDKAEESDRLKTAFLQNISHEIRTPLNAISGFSGLLSTPNLADNKRNNFVSMIQNSSSQLISIVSDIITISSLETKQEKLKLEEVSLNEIIVELLAIFKPQARNQNISLSAKQSLTTNQSAVYTDKAKIIQILTNLLSNAFHFTHKGFIEFGYQLKNEELEFYVKDTGDGIEKKQHKKIFEYFRQANLSIDKNYGGTGLGLSISKGFVELLGGKIWLQSEPDKGSIFYFTIPYNPVSITNTKPLITQNKNAITVLVAEDNEYNFLFIQELLIAMNLKLIHAKNGEETVEICKVNSNIDLILMDIKMPIIDGYQAAKLIKEFRPNLPIIAQTAYALEHEIEKYSGIFNDYLTKPIEKEKLIKKINKYQV